MVFIFCCFVFQKDMDLDPDEESVLMSKDHVLRGTYSLSISLRVDVSGIRHLNTIVYACSLKLNL